MSIYTTDRRSGIYEISCSINGARYIGSALDLRGRAYVHRYRLGKGNHHSAYMQRSWNKHGPAAFKFRVLLVCKPDDLAMYEQRAIDAVKPKFNSNLTAQINLGTTRTDKFRKECRERLLHRFSSEDERKRQSDRLKLAFAKGTGSKAGVLAMCSKESRDKLRAGKAAKSRVHLYKGVLLSCQDVKRVYGVEVETFRQRLKRGWTVADAIEKDVDITKRRKSARNG